jgi:hypothetical protein
VVEMVEGGGGRRKVFFGFRFFSSLERLRTHTHHGKKQHSAQSIKSIRQQQQQQKTSRWEKKGGVECYFIKERERTERKKGEREHFFLFRIFFLRLFQCIVVFNSSFHLRLNRATMMLPRMLSAAMTSRCCPASIGRRETASTAVARRARSLRLSSSIVASSSSSSTSSAAPPSPPLDPSVDARALHNAEQASTFDDAVEAFVETPAEVVPVRSF